MYLAWGVVAYRFMLDVCTTLLMHCNCGCARQSERCFVWSYGRWGIEPM